jgi:endonuclease-3 related protein
MVSAVLTQNTRWENVEKSLENLKNAGVNSFEDILKVPEETLKSLIRPSGFYNQKAERLKFLAEYVIANKGIHGLMKKNKNVLRNELLSIKGIGPETADSILLYALDKLVFPIDAYTKRFWKRFFGEKKSYHELQEIFHKELPKDLEVYKETHALIVELCKNHCKKKPMCDSCPLSKECKKITQN